MRLLGMAGSLAGRSPPC